MKTRFQFKQIFLPVVLAATACLAGIAPGIANAKSNNSFFMLPSSAKTCLAKAYGYVTISFRGSGKYACGGQRVTA